MKIDPGRTNWYAEWYMSALIADEEELNFWAVNYVMKLGFSTDGSF